MHHRALRHVLSSCMLLCGAIVAAAADPQDADVAKAGPPNGLAVQIGASSGSFLAGLTAGGTRLVHGLCLDQATRDQARAALHQAAVHPLATVATWHGAPRLPYADRLVNLLIVDRDALGAQAPSRDECRRVIAAGGTLLERANGAWTTTVIERPASLGNWTHFDGGPDGNAVSSDAEVTGIRGLQWIDNFRDPRWMKTGPHGGHEGNIRCWGRYAVWDYHLLAKNYGSSTKEPGPFQTVSKLVCRDLGNGLPIWERSYEGGAIGRRWGLVVDQGLCFTWLADDGPLTAIDLATGKDVRTYPGSEIKPWQKVSKDGKSKQQTGIQGDNHWVRVAGNTVLANGDGKLRAWSLDGKPLWTFAKEGQRAELPAIDLARKVVYTLLIDDRPVNEWGFGPMMWQRWPTSTAVRAIVAIDLETGVQRWENTELASTDSGLFDAKTKSKVITGFGQLLAAGDHVIAYNTNAISGGGATLVASLDAKTGRTVQFNPKAFIKKIEASGEIKWTGGIYNALWRDGKVWLMGSFNILSFDPVSGAIEEPFGVPWNARCHKAIATANHFILGQTAFIGKDFSGSMAAVARTGCAQSPVPASGLLLFGPHMCACTTHVDGFLATSSRPMPEPVPDAQRLVKLTASNAAPAAAKLPESLITASWPWFTISAPAKSATVEAGGWSFAIDPVRHRVDAKGPGGSWAFVADARLSTSVVVSGGTAVIASHDGWVHGLDLATGAAKWRYLVAPAHRLIIANGMLTSSWPVFGVADLGNGQVVASAGTQVELDGGIRVVALTATDGTPAWTKSIRKTQSPIAAGGNRVRIADRSVINAPPSVVNGKIVIEGGAHLGRLDIDPSESEADINKRLSEPPSRRR